MFLKENPERKKKRKGFVKNIKKQESQKLHHAREYHTNFQGTNVQYVGSSTEKWIEMSSQLENTKYFLNLILV